MSVTQTGWASGEAPFYQAGRDINIGAPPVVPRMESIGAVAGVRRLPVGSGVFVGRSGELERLEAAVKVSGGRAVVVAVHGLGGVGKSTLAARFAELHAGLFSLVWWVTADSAAAIEVGLAELAAAVAPETTVLDWEQRVELGVQWLATHEGWLLVLDNVTASEDVARLLGRVRTGTVLVTSRRGSGWRGAATVPLNALAEAEAVELLTWIVRSEWPDADVDGADRLCAELGWLPLAVEQAAAYLAQNRITPTAYLERLRAYPARMFTATAEGGDAQRTMARVWHVTLDRLTNTPATVEVLRQLAWYAPDGIPRTLLGGGGIVEPELSDALGPLSAYNMITLTADTVVVHRLVQAVTRTPDPADPHRQPDDIAAARDAAAAALAAAVRDRSPETPADHPVFEAVRPHAQSLFDHSTSDTDNGHTVLVFNQLGLYLRDQGTTATAVDLLARAARSNERLHGLTRPTMIARNNLAMAYNSAGRFDEAIALQERNLKDREEVLGPEHADTLSSRNNLATTYQLAGDVRRAIPLYEQTLADHERLLGHDHPDTLMVRSNLAGALQEVGDLGRAIPLFEAVVADRERVLGPEHRRTWDAKNNLASAYDAVGDVRRAIPLHEATLAGLEALLGAGHPDPLRLRNNLAMDYETIGDFDRAIPMLESVLEDRVRLFGSDHPDTLMTRNNLAMAHKHADHLDQAIELYERVLTDFERVLGPDSPDTLIVRNNLAAAYENAGDFDRAIALHETTLADRIRRLGPDHPDTLMSHNNLASAYQSSGDAVRAQEVYETALDDFVRVLGSDHPDTLTLRNNLASAYWITGARDQAYENFDAVFTARERLLGADHPSTLMSKHNLARAHEGRGEYDRAISLFEETYAAQDRVLGRDHSATLRTRYRLAGALESAGRLERALPLYEAVLRDCWHALGPNHALAMMVQKSLETARQL
ncbi:MAG: tetratricopeptide repeat protein [Saccharothrix sp.]|nr:tetratricopeptide repeat protein [Saccharothrix sp.]